MFTKKTQCLGGSGPTMPCSTCSWEASGSTAGSIFIFKPSIIEFDLYIPLFSVTPWQSNYQEWRRYPTGALDSCQSGAGTLQVPWTAVRSGAGTLQVPWTAVRSGAEIGPLSLWFSVSQGASLGDFLLAPACPIEKVTLWDGLYSVQIYRVVMVNVLYWNRNPF